MEHSSTAEGKGLPHEAHDVTLMICQEFDIGEVTLVRSVLRLVLEPSAFRRALSMPRVTKTTGLVISKSAQWQQIDHEHIAQQAVVMRYRIF